MAAQGSVHGRTLAGVYVLCRHGIRFALKPMPNTLCWPRKKKFYQRFGGLLTPQGDAGVRRMSRLLKLAYAPLFQAIDRGSDANGRKVYLDVHTTDKQRTIFTATAFVEAVSARQKRYRYESDDVGLQISSTAARDTVTVYIDDNGEAADGTSDGSSTSSGSGNMDMGPRSFLRPHGMIGGKEPATERYMEHCILARGKTLLLREVNRTLLQQLYRLSGMAGFDCQVACGSRELDAFYTLCTQISIDRALHMPVLANMDGVRLSATELDSICRQRTVIYNIKHAGCCLEAMLLMAYTRTRRAALSLVEWLMKIKDSVVNENEMPVFAFHASHDSVIMAMLSLLGFREFSFPEFAACIIVECWQREGSSDMDVRVLYCDHALDDVDELPLFRYAYVLPATAAAVKMEEASRESGHAYSSVQLLIDKLCYCPVCKTVVLPGSIHQSKETVEMAMSAVIANEMQTPGHIREYSAAGNGGMYHVGLTEKEETCILCGHSAAYRCAGCGDVCYCSPVHQKLDWPQHEHKCSRR